MVSSTILYGKYQLLCTASESTKLFSKFIAIPRNVASFFSDKNEL